MMKNQKSLAVRLLPLVAIEVLLAGGLVHAAGSAPKAPELPDSILAHWSFDEKTWDGDTVKDSGPKAYHGTVRSQNDHVPAPVPGIRGQALNFPSGHESWVALDKNLTVRPPFTIAAWVKLSGRRGTMELLGQKAHSNREGLRLVFSARQFFFEYGDGAENVFVRFDPHQTELNQWVFVAVVHDGEEISLYVDGERVQRAAARPAQWSSRPMLLGNYTVDKKDYRFLGAMDEVMILEEALDERGISALGRWALENGK
jgi:hypothetical protein